MRVICLILILLGLSDLALAKPQYGYLLDLRARYANHLLQSNEQSSHRLSFQFSQNWQDGDWSSAASIETRSESAFAANPDRYSTEVAQKNSSEFLPRDVYLQYFSGPVFARLGYQQVVWGEAFGFAYADVINPKDFREIGLGELTELRRQIPMANLKYIGKDYSLQVLYIPGPYFNLYPTPGAEFSYIPYSGALATAELSIDEDTRSGYSAESGLRVTKTFGTYDLSLLYFDGYDRNPLLRSTVTSLTPLRVTLTPYHEKYVLYGGTLTADFENFLLRSEVIFHQARILQTYNATTGLGVREANQAVAVIGIDLTQIPTWQIGFQYSQDMLTSEEPGDTRAKNLDLLSVRLSRDLGRFTKIDLVGGISSIDGSYLLQTKATRTLTKAAEVDLGIDYLDGNPNTQFGVYRQYSRVFLMFRLKDSG